MTRKDILDSIIQERNRQDIKWGGARHDDKHTQEDWEGYIKDHCAFSLKTGFRQRMIEVAALAVAAVQSHDRKYPSNETL